MSAYFPFKTYNLVYYGVDNYVRMYSIERRLGFNCCRGKHSSFTKGSHVDVYYCSIIRIPYNEGLLSHNINVKEHHLSAKSPKKKNV